MKTSLVNPNKLHTHFITTKTKLLTLLVVFLASMGWGQSASQYSFAVATETYAQITGTTSTATGDDGTQTNISIGFNFNYGGVTYTKFGVSTNGIIRLGSDASTTTFSSAHSNSFSTSNANRPLIAAFWDDNNLSSGSIRYSLTGTAPNQVLTINWHDTKVGGSGSTSGSANSFLIRLYETSNVIEIVYGATISSTNSVSASVGLNDMSSFLSLTPGSTFTSSSFTADNSISSSTMTSLGGKKITFTPPTPCSGTPTPGTITSNTSQNVCSGSTPVALSVTGTTSGVTGITYQWEESTDNATWANATGGSGSTAASYTPPAFGGTTIYYRCKVTCSGSSLFDVTNVATIALPVNPSTQASSLAFSSLSYTGFTASWTNGNGNRRVVYVSDAAITDPTNNSGAAALTANTTFSGSGQQIVYDGTGTSVSVTGLALGTTYNVKVIEYTRCGSSTFDNYFNVTSGTNSNTVTTSTASTVPWSEGFATTSLPANWLTTAGSVGTTTALNPAISSNYYYVNLDGSPSTAAITTPIIGSIPSNYRFVVKYKLANYSSPYASPAAGSGNFIVAISTNNGTSYSDVATVANNTVAGWQEYALNLSAYVGQNIRIRLTGNYSSGDYYLAFDDFSVEAVPSCFVPTSLSVASITNAAASLSWTAPATAPGSGYEVYYSTTNTAPTAGTTPSASVASGTTYSFNGLTANTTYYSWVRSNCGGSDVSLWVASASFTTLQIPATVPYSTNFTTNDFTFINGSQTNKWAYGTAVGNTGSSIYVTNDNGVTNAYTNGSTSVVQVYRDIAIPAGATIAQFSFDWLGNGESTYDYTRVWLSPTTFVPTSGTQITSGSGRIQVGSNFELQSTWQTYTNNTLDVSSFANTTMRLIFEWRNDGSGGSNPPGAIDNINFKVPFVWTGTTSTDWATTTNWNLGAIPASTDNIVIPSSGITNFPVATSLTIAAGSTMSLNANARLTVNGTLTNNGTLNLESGATLVQGTGNTVAGSGTFNVKQALTGAGGATPSGRHWYLGSPVSTATSNVFNAAGNNRLWTYSETALAYNTEITDNTTALSPMQGTVVRLGANETSIFTGGLLNTGDFTSSLTRTGTTDSKRGYTLLSNPYPSYLDWSAAYNAAVASNANISSSIWYRSHNSTSNTMVFDIFNASGSVATTNSSGTTTQYIPPMQAFWVYNPNDGTTGSLTFSNSMRSHQSNGGLKSSTDFPAFVRLNLENDGAIDQTVLYFDNNAAAGYDNFDSDKMMLANAAQVYSFVDSKKLAINGMKSIKANKQVPLTVEFPTAKSYAFNATEVVMTDGIVLLEDRLTKVFQDLTMNPVYEFEAAAGTDADRFVVHFQANGGVAGIESAEENGIAIVSNATGLVTITLSEELPAMGTIQIIDANGKVIATQAINEQATTMNINAATGIYHVLVDTSSKIARKKIVITK